MKIVPERLYWVLVALMAAGWVTALVSQFAIAGLGHLGPLGDVAAGMGILVFPGFPFWLVPGLLLEIVLQSRQAARLVTRSSATLVYIALLSPVRSGAGPKASHPSRFTA